MAYTTTLTKKTVFGDSRVHMYDIIADAATAEIATGFDFIDHVQPAVNSAATYGAKWSKNVLTAATASNGTLSVTGCASGDTYYVTVYGK